MPGDRVDECPFCNLDATRIVWQSDSVVVIRDGYPVSPGHSLVITRRHVATWFDASAEEQPAIMAAVSEVKRALDQQYAPQGYNVGFNSGVAAGQTVMHLHVHVIPRFVGDVEDPRGGVRGVIPSRQGYDASAPPTTDEDPFASIASLVTGESDHFGPVLLRALAVAREADLLAAFVQKSGIDEIEDELVDALARGTSIRVLTGDYLGVTHPHALQRLHTLATEYPKLRAKLFRTVPIDSPPTGRGVAFHPKAYIFASGTHGVAFVGSSNLSRSALTNGIEWNLRASAAESTFGHLRAHFDRLFDAPEAQDLSAAVIAAYQQIVRIPAGPEPAAPPPQQRELQQRVLDQLRATRDDGRQRGLVVMATGLGKTYLSAFDFEQLGGKRALFVAHREEILRQAAAAWARVHPGRSIGFLNSETKDADADLLFASVQTLSRIEHLHRFAPDHFDYIVIDEFHHAAAESYRKLLGWFEPKFLLGLTATPDRMDGAGLLDLCEDNLVAQIGLVEGIQSGDLVPFHYFGVRDEIDFATIPWRSGRFDLEALTRAAATRERADQALREYLARAPQSRRAIIFCCTQDHADFIAAHFRDHGVAAAAVHTGPKSAPRARSVAQLRSGELEAIVAVDIFNEGVDLPDVNTIMMLRPTESPVIFLQQLGRGLRRGQTIDKPFLTVIDFIGNHRSFLVKPQALLALTGQRVRPADALRRVREGLVDLPDGCSVDIETDTLDMLERLARLSSNDHLLFTYASLRDSFGRRPTAREMFGAGVNLGAIRPRYTTWFDFVAAQGDLLDGEQVVLDKHRLWFEDLTTTRLTRSYKMVTLEVMNDHDWLHTQVGVDELSLRCRERMRRDPDLRSELGESEAGSADSFAQQWRKMPLGIFHAAEGFSRRWFALEDAVFVSQLGVESADRFVFDRMTAELVELRLRTHRARGSPTESAGIELIVSHTGGNPILRFDRQRNPSIPLGDVAVLVEDTRYTFRFVKIAVNVVTERPGGPNCLPELMRRWFGRHAGQPGSHHRVELVTDADGSHRLIKRESSADVIPLRQPAANEVPYYEDLAVACGVTREQFVDHDLSRPLAIESTRELDPKRHFVVRASGDSMNGGEHPIADGALVLCEWTSETDPSSVENRIVLLTGGSPGEVFSLLKIPIRVGKGWVLRSANPGVGDQPIEADLKLRVVARFLEVVRAAER